MAAVNAPCMVVCGFTHLGVFWFPLKLLLFLECTVCSYLCLCFFFSHDVPSAWNDLPSWSSWEFSPFFWNNLSSFAPPLGRGLWPPEALPSLCSPGTSLLAALHMAILQGLFHRCDFLLTWLFCFIIISPKRQALYFTHLVFSKL